MSCSVSFTGCVETIHIYEFSTTSEIQNAKHYLFIVVPRGVKYLTSGARSVFSLVAFLDGGCYICHQRKTNKHKEQKIEM